jgi:hypothetical protein
MRFFLIMIPKIIFQTSKKKHFLLEEYYKKIYKDYQYFYFDDNNFIEYIDAHQITEFPNVKNKFQQFKNGAHKADLIRYYWLYMNGGIYIDSDIEPIESLDSFINLDANFISVITSPGRGFNGLIACAPNHPIIYDCLNHIYCTDPKHIPNYLYFCEYFYKAIMNNNDSKYLLSEQFISDGRTKIIDPLDKKIKFIHYFKHKHRTFSRLLDKMNREEDFFFNNVFIN